MGKGQGFLSDLKKRQMGEVGRRGEAGEGEEGERQEKRGAGRPSSSRLPACEEEELGLLTTTTP